MDGFDGVGREGGLGSGLERYGDLKCVSAARWGRVLGLVVVVVVAVSAVAVAVISIAEEARLGFGGEWKRIITGGEEMRYNRVGVGKVRWEES